MLHFPPTGRAFQPGDLVLIDAGAEHLGYASDITRTYPVGGTLNPEQEALHSLVRAAALAPMERCTDGTEARELHRTAARMIAEGLVDFGLLRGDPDTLVEREAVSLFSPTASATWSASACAMRAGRSAGPTGTSSRSCAWTCHCERASRSPSSRGSTSCRRSCSTPSGAGSTATVDWDRTDRMLDFGGIRIEDNVLVKDDTYEILTGDVPVLGSAL